MTPHTRIAALAASLATTLAVAVGAVAMGGHDPVDTRLVERTGTESVATTLAPTPVDASPDATLSTLATLAPRPVPAGPSLTPADPDPDPAPVIADPPTTQAPQPPTTTTTEAPEPPVCAVIRANLAGRARSDPDPATGLRTSYDGEIPTWRQFWPTYPCRGAFPPVAP
jgi:hypothetical protein